MTAPETQMLSGLNVLLTRPAAQAASVAAAIRAHGGKVVSLPLLEIEAVTERAEVERIKSCIMALDNFDIAIFISTNAATLGLEWIENYWPQLPEGVVAYAVGPGTAQILKQLPWPVHCADTGVTSEDMLALPGLHDVAGKRIALFRGKGGRELIADALRARGARVDYLELYTRRVPNYAPERMQEMIAAENINVVVTTSLQILETFLALLGPTNESSALSQRLCVIVPSQRVRDVALAAGLARVIDAGGADDESLLASLQRCRRELQSITEVP